VSAPIEISYEVVVVGAGGAGMTAALAATRHGLRTLLLEKSGYFGGSTARSGGGVWIPGNYALDEAGQDDDLDDAKKYLDCIVGDEVSKTRRDTYLARGPEVLGFLRTHTPLRFQWVPGYPDYYPEAPGGRPAGRTVEPVPLDARCLGEELARLHPPYSASPVNLIFTQADYRQLHLGLRNSRTPLVVGRALLRKVAASARSQRLHSMGSALAVGLRKGLLDAQVPLWYDTELVGLQVQQGRVTGVHVSREGEAVTIRATRGVVLTSGGFERSPSLREEHLPHPTSVDWTAGSEFNTGAGLGAGLAAGAQTALLDDAWWGPTIPRPEGPWFCLSERNLPGSIIVNQAGKRFMNEALPYVDAVHETYKGEATGVGHVPSWLVIDQRYRNRYVFAGLSPRLPFPRAWYEHGTVHRATTLAELAAAIGVPADALVDTVERFNRFARAGLDEDFHRGESAYDAYYSDPRVLPNPSLHVLDKAPFYAVKIVPGDLGTKGGLLTDERARVLRPDGSVIDGLYAAGNVSAAVMGRTYAGPGATLGPAITFGYLAAEDLARQRQAGSLSAPS
jgi:3-oxosteroid 1-dehydrogenase